MSKRGADSLRTASCPIENDTTHDKRDALAAKSYRLSNDVAMSKYAPGAYLLIESKSRPHLLRSEGMRRAHGLKKSSRTLNLSVWVVCVKYEASKCGISRNRSFSSNQKMPSYYNAVLFQMLRQSGSIVNVILGGLCRLRGVMRNWFSDFAQFCVERGITINSAEFRQNIPIRHFNSRPDQTGTHSLKSLKARNLRHFHALRRQKESVCSSVGVPAAKNSKKRPGRNQNGTTNLQYGSTSNMAPMSWLHALMLRYL